MSAIVAVVGLGYVGLPLVHTLSKAGFFVRGFDIDVRKIERLRAGESYIEDISDEDIRSLRGVEFDSDPSILKEATFISVCVPTPINGKQEPDYGPMLSALGMVRDHAAKGSIVVIESTVGPGFSKRISSTLLQGFGVVFSPERVDPSNSDFTIQDIPKVAGSDCPLVYARFEEVYSKAFTLHKMPDTKSAELVKLLENTFRAVNLGFIHEFDDMCRDLGVDTRGVVSAASTKPFGFMPFYPSVGVGGHCIPVDPYYLLAERESKFIRSAMEINKLRPETCFRSLVPYFGQDPVLFVGVAYKPNVGDVRESPALDLLNMICEMTDVVYYDPHVPSVTLDTGEVLEAAGHDTLVARSYSMVVFAVNHTAVDAKNLSELSERVFDFCGATQK